jgi:hypothetical protein
MSKKPFGGNGTGPGLFAETQLLKKRKSVSHFFFFERGRKQKEGGRIVKVRTQISHSRVKEVVKEAGAG